MPVPVEYPNKVTKADFIAVATEVNSKVSAVSPLSLIAGAATDIPLLIQGAASQTANLQEWQNSSGTVIASVSATGDLYTTNAILMGEYRSASLSVNVRPHVAGEKGLVIRGAASQTANLQEWQNSAGTVISRIGPNGEAYLGDTFINTGVISPSLATIDPAARFAVGTSAAAVKGIVVRGAASQTANLAEFQTSTGTVVTRVGWAGTLGVNMNADGLSWAAFTGQGVSDRIIVVRGVASQSGNLAEFQNSSGTVLSNIGPDGRFRTVGTNSVTITGNLGGAVGALINSIHVVVDGSNYKIPLYTY